MPEVSDQTKSQSPASNTAVNNKKTQAQGLTFHRFFTKPGVSPCLLYTSPSPRDRQKSRMPSSA